MKINLYSLIVFAASCLWLTGCSPEATNNTVAVQPEAQAQNSASWVSLNSADTTRRWIVEFQKNKLTVTAGCIGSEFFEGPYAIDSSVIPCRINMHIAQSTYLSEIGKTVTGILSTQADSFQLALGLPGVGAYPAGFTPTDSCRVFTAGPRPKVSILPNIPVLARPGKSVTIPLVYKEWTTIYPTFTWQEVAGAEYYNLQVAEDKDFKFLIYSDCGLLNTTKRYKLPFPYYTVFYWRVSATNSSGTSEWSPVFHFMTKPDL